VRERADTAPTIVAPFGSYNSGRLKSEEKRIMFKKFLLFTIASLVMLPALADKPRDKGNKGGGAVPLCVTFDDGYSFVSDLLGDYCDGDAGVTTQIGKFRFGLNVGLNSPDRNFSLNLDDCLDTPLPKVCEPNTIYVKGWNVFSASPDGAEYLKMKDTDPPKPVNFQLDFFDVNDDAWRIQFNPSECPNFDGYPAPTMAKVTKTNLGWTFEANENAVACLYFLEGPRKFHTFNGLYHVPFRIEAVAK